MIASETVATTQEVRVSMLAMAAEDARPDRMRPEMNSWADHSRSLRGL
jgi:hypothetical protein